MSKNLVIVESPAKAKTIEKFLGDDFHVLSSQGHIRDIEGQGKNSLGIDFKHGYEPNYVVDSSKEHLIQTLRSEAAKAEMVWLASDEDREGEAIAWHLKEVLHLKPEHTRRVVFHEITKSAILHAIENPRDIDYNLVNAQQARRVLDRIVGFELSPVLWRKIATGLSAGRVQSVAVRLVVEREEGIEQFVSTDQYRITADFVGADAQGNAAVLHTELNHRFLTQEEAIAFLEQIKTASFRLESIQKKPGKKSPAPPFTTSSLQQEAARKREKAKAPKPVLEIKNNASSSFDIYQQLKLTFAWPLEKWEPDSLRLWHVHPLAEGNDPNAERQKDSVDFEFVKLDSCGSQFAIKAAWEAGQQYELEIDSAAFTSIYGVSSVKQVLKLGIKTLEDYATLIMKIEPFNPKMMIQVLSEKDEPVRTLRASEEGARFEYLNPESYYIRIYEDVNGDSVWTTGDWLKHRQPEPVYYFDRKLTLKANWDFEETFNYLEKAVLEQKPQELRKDAGGKKNK